MSGPPPPPPPPPTFTHTAAAPLPKGASLASLLASNNLATGDIGSTHGEIGAGGNARDAAPDVIKAPTSPREIKKVANPFMDELAARVGNPKDFEDAPSNPSMVVPGYKAPAGLPAKGTQGHEMVHYSMSGPSIGKVQAATEFSIHCRNDAKELVEIPPSILEAEITQNKEKGETLMGKIEKTSEKGVLKATFRARFVGEYHIQLYVKGQLERRSVYPEPGVPLQILAADPIVKENYHFTCAGFGMYGGTVAKTVSFEIIVKNDKGEPRDIDRERLRVMLSQGLKKSDGHVERIGDGKYKAELTPFGPGEMVVKVQYGGQDVVETSVSFNAGIDASTTEIVNPPTGKIPLNVQQTFKIQAKDAGGKEIPNGGEKFEVGVSGPSQGTTGLVVRDELNGTYIVRFTLTKPGDYSIFVSLKGKALKGSPLKVKAE